MASTLGRRRWLQGSACGFGALALQSLLATPSLAGTSTPRLPTAKRIIFLFMQGGVSQVDSFDYKPLINQRAGEVLTFADARQLAKVGRNTEQTLLPTPWSFSQHGQSSRWVSELFPHMAKHVDDLCFLHAMHTNGVAHGPATLFLHCGAMQEARPSFGSWVLYGLGAENQNLPGFVSIAPSLGNGGVRNFGSAFLPTNCQGSPIGSPSTELLEIAALQSPFSNEREMARRELLRQVNQHQAAKLGASDELNGVLESHELAWRMQAVAPEVLDLTNETAETHQAYGLDQPQTRSYGRRCLLARRLCEAGVRFIQVNYGDNSANPAWDQHSNLPKHAEHAAAVDQPIAALLADLKQRGLLEDTIVWWGSEFGRTPYSENNGTGRDHNPNGFTMWVAGGGFKPGFAYGETDEFGFQGIQGRIHMHDLHATLLHQLGLNHLELTYKHAGRDFRLTDVHGRVVQEILP
ncbi:MAG: DUF1501 domain-containing protein [Pirellulaceae bacterium]|nr:DUF1501 domain-containing protein [Pirellulaceae bacterium]